jgi:hypothetical protein
MGVELRSFQTSTATSGSTAHTLVDTAYPYRTNLKDGAYMDYTNWWLFRPNAVAAGDVQRQVMTYHGPTGTFTPDLGYTNSPVNEEYELWNVGLLFDEINDSINHALQRMFSIDRFWVVPPEDSVRTSFLRYAPPPDAQGWLTNSKWINQIRSITEPPLLTPTLSVSIRSSVVYTGVLASFQRDRTQGGIRRVQVDTGSHSGAGPVVLAAPQAPTVGNLLVLAVSTYGSAITTPTGYTLLATATSGNILTKIYYAYPTSADTSLTSLSVTYTGSSATAVLAEYQGLLPSGVDLSGTGTGTGTTATVSATSRAAQGDELLLAAFGVGYEGPVYGPTERFARVAAVQSGNTGQADSLTLYERNLSLTDLQEREPNLVEGGQVDPLTEEQGEVYFYPLTPIASPSAYLIDAQRPLFTYCRVDASGQFGTKLDGLTAEGNEVEGDAQDGTLDAIVAGAITYAWERYPAFQKMADAERKAKIAAARERFLAFNRARASRPHKRFRSREVVGLI